MDENCIICKKKIYRSTYKYAQKSRRSIKCVTCSKDCSRIYRDVSTKIKGNYQHKFNQLKKQLEKYEKKK